MNQHAPSAAIVRELVARLELTPQERYRAGLALDALDPKPETGIGPTIGRAVTYRIGTQRVLLGIERSTGYSHRPTRGYVAIESAAQRKRRGDETLGADALRRLGQNLLELAATLDAWTAADAETVAVAS